MLFAVKKNLYTVTVCEKECVILENQNLEINSEWEKVYNFHMKELDPRNCDNVD
jgi:hypothetical protein